jgi:hypothetical protein
MIPLSMPNGIGTLLTLLLALLLAVKFLPESEDAMTLEEKLEELYEMLARLREQQTPYLMTAQEDADMWHLLKELADAIGQDMEDEQGSAW